MSRRERDRQTSQHFVDFNSTLRGVKMTPGAIEMLAETMAKAGYETAGFAENPVVGDAFGVAQAFHSYYQKPQHSVLHAETDALRAFRTLVVDCFVREMETLLGLLGIPVPERM